MKPLINAAEVHATMEYCLFSDSEIANYIPGTAPPGAVIVESVVGKFGFHPGRLDEKKATIRAMLDNLDPAFRADMADGGGGWSFLNMPLDKNGEQWGEQPTANALLALGIAIDYARILIPRDMWSVFPGGVPCVQIGEPAR